ncbi:hypothetical protein [Pseudomonas entomophila]|nr:hypothetical protein [Pseudomonas entomophila]MCG8291993.1 hypothetical protein [Pseudomonas entomophila]
MDAAPRLCRAAYDSQLPPVVNDDEADQVEWVEKHAAQLVLGYRVC